MSAASTGLLTALSVAEALVLVAVLAIALIKVDRRLRTISGALGHLGTALASSERQLRDLDVVVETANAPLRAIVDTVPGLADLAETAARR